MFDSEIVRNVGTVLNLASGPTPLVQDVFTPGNPISLQGTKTLEARVSATFDGSSSATSIDFRVELSDDLTHWDPLVTSRLGTDDILAIHLLAVSLGATVSDRLQTQAHSNAKYVRISARMTGGAPKSGDAALATLSFSE